MYGKNTKLSLDLLVHEFLYRVGFIDDAHSGFCQDLGLDTLHVFYHRYPLCFGGFGHHQSLFDF